MAHAVRDKPTGARFVKDHCITDGPGEIRSLRRRFRNQFGGSTCCGEQLEFQLFVVLAPSEPPHR